MPPRQIAGLTRDTGQSEFGGIPLLDVFRQGHGLESPPCLGREVCSREQAGTERFLRMGGVPPGRLPRGALGLHVIERLLGHRVQIDARDRDLKHGFLVEEQVALSP